MTHTDSNNFSDLLNLEMDGALSAAEEAELQARLDRDDELASERRQMERLGELLTASRVAVRPGFHEEVMAALPPAAWEVRRAGGWRLAAASAAMLLVAALALVALSGGGLSAAGPVFGLTGAVGAFLQSSLLVGAGLLAASWMGAGLVVGDMLAGSTATLVAFLAFVVGLNAVFLTLLFGRSRQPRAAGSVAPPGSNIDS